MIIIRIRNCCWFPLSGTVACRLQVRQTSKHTSTQMSFSCFYPFGKKHFPFPVILYFAKRTWDSHSLFAESPWKRDVFVVFLKNHSEWLNVTLRRYRQSFLKLSAQRKHASAPLIGFENLPVNGRWGTEDIMILLLTPWGLYSGSICFTRLLSFKAFPHRDAWHTHACARGAGAAVCQQ